MLWVRSGFVVCSRVASRLVLARAKVVANAQLVAVFFKRNRVDNLLVLSRE